MNINYLIKTIEYNPQNNNNNLMTKINKKILY